MTMTRKESGKMGYEKSKMQIIAWVAEQKRRSVAKHAGKKCPACLTLLPYEKRSNKHCSRSCAGGQINLHRRVKRNCKNCEEELSPDQRTFCSHSCNQERLYKEFIQRWLKAEESGGNWYEVSAYVRRWLIETRGRRCESCGWEKCNSITGLTPIQVNHRDGNPQNHRPENLELLCPSCHSLTPNFGGLNRGFGRWARKKRLPSTNGSATVS
jgi:hypothetical protein